MHESKGSGLTQPVCIPDPPNTYCVALEKFVKILPSFNLHPFH